MHDGTGSSKWTHNVFRMLYTCAEHDTANSCLGLIEKKALCEIY